jgi:hypothetical protein
MIQNSLDRIFEGIARSLHTSVLPALDDRHAIAQVRATIELLGNLSTRVNWDPTYLTATRDRVRATLGQIAASAGDATPTSVQQALSAVDPEPGDVPGLAAARNRDLEALADGQAWVAAAMAAGVDGAVGAMEAVRDFLAWQLADEFERLRTASFGRR